MMTVQLRSLTLNDSHSLGAVTVYADEASASSHKVDKPQEETIAFLKEQQWSLDFATERVSELERILASVHVVDPPDAPPNSVTFGAIVTVKDKKGTIETFTIVGVDELDFEQDAVSWISPIGKALLNADMGDWITFEDGRSTKIVKIAAS